MAKFRIKAAAPKRFETDVEAYSLSYDCATGTFVMGTADCDIPPDRPYKPKRIHMQWNTLFVEFEKREEAEQFVDWIKEANVVAEESFRHMSS